MDREYTFKIEDSFTPDSLPAARFAEYVAELARLLGETECVHFRAVTAGSVKLTMAVEDPARVRVRSRLEAVRTGVNAPRDAVKAQAALDAMLERDNAIGSLAGEQGAVVLAFPGRNRPKPLIYGPFWRDGTIQGQIVSIGGRDATVHIQLQDGPLVHTGIETNRGLAVELRGHLYGATVRLSGRGKHVRGQDGIWALEGFKAQAFEVLDDSPLSNIVTRLRAVAGSGWGESADPVGELLAMRSDDEAAH